VVDDVIWGCVSQVGEQTFDIARTAVLAAGWPETVTGVTVDRQCGSSQQSVHFAAAGLIAGQYDVVVAGGVESMSRVPMGSRWHGANPLRRPFLERYDGRVPNQGVGAEMIAERGASPAPSSTSSRSPRTRRPRRARRGPLRRPDRAGDPARRHGVEQDEGIRARHAWRSWPLKTGFKPEGGVITAGNSSQISDGSAALLMTTARRRASWG
jgi:acetyl-CoA acyltransferase